jgi:hypothetical protein
MLEKLSASNGHLSVRLAGTGSLPQQRRASLQAGVRLAACTTPLGVFDPTSWPLCNALSSVHASFPDAHSTPYTTLADSFQAMFQATSLVQLAVSHVPHDSFPLLAHLSNLRSLTRLSLEARTWQQDRVQRRPALRPLPAQPAGSTTCTSARPTPASTAGTLSSATPGPLAPPPPAGVAAASRSCTCATSAWT